MNLPPEASKPLRVTHGPYPVRAGLTVEEVERALSEHGFVEYRERPTETRNAE